MAEPVRDQALDQIVLKLKGMTGNRPWGGAYPNNPVVERKWREVTAVNEFPHLCVVEGPGSTFAQEATGSATQAMHLHEFKVMVYGYVKADGAVTRSRWLQRLWDDVVRTLIGDSTLGGVVRDMTIDPNVETDEGELEPTGAFAQGVTVIMDELVTMG